MTLEEIMDRLGALGHEKVKMNKTNHLQNEVSRVKAEDFGRVLEVWEASVRATHDFVLETDIQFFKPIVRDVIPKMPALTCIRDHEHQVLGFLGASDGKVEMLFIHPDWRGQGIGKQLLEHAINTLGATELEVNEQNPQAVGFYLKMSFEVIGRSERDGTNKPYPLLHMRLKANSSNLL